MVVVGHVIAEFRGKSIGKRERSTLADRAGVEANVSSVSQQSWGAGN